MLFGFIMPIILGGYANYFIPTMLGVPDMIFARINNLSFLIYLLGVQLLTISTFIEEGIGTGWTLYPTLICNEFHSSISVDIAIVSVHTLGISSILNSINMIVTILLTQLRTFSLTQLNLFIWSTLITSMLLIIILPILAGSVTMILLDRNISTCFFDVLGGGDLLLFQHLFWFFGHPEVYVIIIPIFGLVSLMIEVLTYRSIFSWFSMIYSMLSISILGFFVWAHHMFTTGLDIDSRSYFGSVTIIIGVPTCIKLFNWIYSIINNVILIQLELLFIGMFIFMFIIGGVTGLILANSSIDIQLHDTYFVVAHFHYVLSLGAAIGAIGSFLYFSNKLLSIEYNCINIHIGFNLLFWGSNIVFLPLHTLGLFGFPRRISDFPQVFSCTFGIFMLIWLLLIWFIWNFFSLKLYCNNNLNLILTTFYKSNNEFYADDLLHNNIHQGSLINKEYKLKY